DEIAHRENAADAPYKGGNEANAPFDDSPENRPHAVVALRRPERVGKDPGSDDQSSHDHTRDGDRDRSRDGGSPGPKIINAGHRSANEQNAQRTAVETLTSDRHVWPISPGLCGA